MMNVALSFFVPVLNCRRMRLEGIQIEIGADTTNEIKYQS